MAHGVKGITQRLSSFADLIVATIGLEPPTFLLIATRLQATVMFSSTGNVHLLKIMLLVIIS